MKTKTGTAIVAVLLVTACNKGADGNNVSANVAAPAPNANAAALATPVVAAQASDVDGARRLIDAVYTPYTRDQIVDYFRYFTPELNAAIDHAGEGAIEADPLCECQDFTRFTYRVQSLEAETGGAVARVAISNNGEAKTIILHLVQRDGGWLIADVGEGASSLTSSLRR